MKMKITKFIIPFILFLSSLACGTLSGDIGTPIATIDPTATSVQATLDPMDFNTPPTEDIGTPIATIDPTATSVQATLDPMEFNTPPAEDFRPVSPVWLEDENTFSGRTFPAYLSGLSFRDDSVWLVDQNGVANMAMGQPAAGQLSPDGTGFLFPGSEYGSNIFYYLKCCEFSSFR